LAKAACCNTSGGKAEEVLGHTMALEK